MASRLKDKYNIEICASDANPGYGKFEIAQKHVVTKAETALVECYNSLLRHYLARFNRKTKRFSKALDMIKHSVWLLLYKLNKTILPSTLACL